MNKNWAYLLLLGPVLFWSGNFVIGRATSADIDPLVLSFFRWALAAVIFLPFSFLSLWHDRAVIWQHRWWLLAMGTFGVAGFNTFVYLGLQSTSATNALLINSFIPIFILLLTRLWLGEVLSSRKLVAIVVSSVGVLVLLLEGKVQNLLTLNIGRGDLWVLLAALDWAIYSISLRWRPLALSSSAFLMVTMIIGVIILIPVYLFSVNQGQQLVINQDNLLTIVYVALFASIGAFLLWNQGVRMVGAATAGQYIHLMPVLGTLMAIIFLGEQLYWFHIVGAIAIGSGVYLSLSQRK